jgi:rhamnosyltransferase
MTKKLSQQAPVTQPNRSGVAVVVVLYDPCTNDLHHLAEMTKWGVQVVAVVNAIAEEQRRMMPSEVGLTAITNPRNLGLAPALNQGVAAAFAADARYVLMLDQDSRPSPAVLDRLAAEATAILARGRRLACVAPILRDGKAAGASVGVRSVDFGQRTFATSGTMLTRQGWEEVGPMWDQLFIDGIDHEWCFRAHAKGFETVLVEDAVMEHNMGDSAINVLGRFRPVHRSPLRHYFIIRNTLWLVRRPYIPLRWRLSELCKLAYRIPAYFAFSCDRARTVGNIAAAIADGVCRTTLRQPV